MPTKRKGRAAESLPAPQSAGKPIELVVRRGALWRFNTLKKKTADLPVTVMWDRRQGERRAGSDARAQERRGADRRQQPPFTWEVADFVVVGPIAPDGTPASPLAAAVEPSGDAGGPAGPATLRNPAARPRRRVPGSRADRGPKVPRKKKP